jgi:hypothetical protein
MTDLARDVLMLSELANEIAKAVEEQDYPADLGEALVVWKVLGEAVKTLADARDASAADLAEDMPEKRMTVMEIGTFIRHGKRAGAPKCTDEMGLWRYVLDTRVPDPETGEVIPQHEVIRMAYGSRSKETGDVRLTGSSPSKLEVLGIDPDDFFEKQPFTGWTLEVVTS